MSSVLIVDDLKMMNNGLARSLLEDNHIVTQAYTLADATDAVKTEEFDYILLDLILPDGEGEMLLPFVQKTKSKVIVLTTDRDSFRRDRIFNFGVVDYILKDKVFHEIVRSIKELFVQIESNTEYTILVVDDSSFMRTHISQMLSRRGINIIQATNGREALSMLLSRRHIDAAIVDLEMPEMDGLTLLEKMKKNISIEEIPVMILTGSNDANVIAKVIKSGVAEFNRKPYIVEELLLKVDNMINRLKQTKLLEKKHLRFGMYYDAMKTSTLFLRLNDEMKIEYINKDMKNLVGSTALPTSLEDIIDGNVETFLEELQSHIYKNISYQTSFKVKCDDSKKAYIFATFSPVLSSEDVLEEILMIAQDITALEEYKEELNQKVEEQTSINLEQKNVMFQQAKMAAMGEMIGNIAHQWRQPLNVLALGIQDLEDAYDFNEMDKDYLSGMVEKSMKQINYMSKTIDDFRDFTNPKHSKEYLDINIVLRESMELTVGSLINNNIEYKVEYFREPLIVFGSSGELKQVIINIINNARDAITENKIQDATIKIFIDLKEHEVEINIEDNGGGIPPKVLGRIFEPYFTTKEEGKGTGIGLYMSHMIIKDKMGGSLYASNVKNGALFTIKIPLAENKIEKGQDVEDD